VKIQHQKQRPDNLSSPQSQDGIFRPIYSPLYSEADVISQQGLVEGIVRASKERGNVNALHASTSAMMRTLVNASSDAAISASGDSGTDDPSGNSKENNESHSRSVSGSPSKTRRQNIQNITNIEGGSGQQEQSESDQQILDSILREKLEEINVLSKGNSSSGNLVQGGRDEDTSNDQSRQARICVGFDLAARSGTSYDFNLNDTSENRLLQANAFFDGDLEKSSQYRIAGISFPIFALCLDCWLGSIRKRKGGCDFAKLYFLSGAHQRLRKGVLFLD